VSFRDREKIGCEACQFEAVILLGTRKLCYFCCRIAVFDMVRNLPVSFEPKGKSGNLQVIAYRVSNKPVLKSA
jgi:hypothetical protein